MFKKSVIKLSILLLTVTSTLNISSQTNANIYAATNTKITYKQAEILVRSYLLSKKIISSQDKKMVIQYDHMDSAHGKSYYVIHVYDNMKDHTATIGWYGIDKNGNTIYDFIFCKKLR